MGGKHLNAPIVGIAATADGGGYWLVAKDGGVFNFGDAKFYGSRGGQALNAPVVGIAADNATGGYWEVASDGGIFNYNAPFLGGRGGQALNAPVVGIAATASGSGYWLERAGGRGRARLSGGHPPPAARLASSCPARRLPDSGRGPLPLDRMGAVL